MPAFLPPGQGVTVRLPAGATQPVAQPAVATPSPAAPEPAPEPFRRVAGPDITLLPHGGEPKAPRQPAQPPKPTQPFQPAQMRRKWRPLKLDRVTESNVKSFAKYAATIPPSDEAPHLTFADYLQENSDPRHNIVRAYIENERKPKGKKILPWEHRNALAAHEQIQSFYGPDGSWTKIVPSSQDINKTVVRYIPHLDVKLGDGNAPDYHTVVSKDTADEIREHLVKIGAGPKRIIPRGFA